MPQNEDQKKQEPRKVPAHPSPFKKKTLLIVDDDPKIRKLLGLMIREENCDVLEAGNATECMERLSLHQVDLCLLDIDMPNMDGITLASMIRNQASYADIPLIMVTAKSDQHSVIRALKAGARDYVLKPVDKAVLLQKIHKYLKLEEVQRPGLPGKQQERPPAPNEARQEDSPERNPDREKAVQSETGKEVDS